MSEQWLPVFAMFCSLFDVNVFEYDVIYIYWNCSLLWSILCCGFKAWCVSSKPYEVCTMEDLKSWVLHRLQLV